MLNRRGFFFLFPVRPGGFFLRLLFLFCGTVARFWVGFFLGCSGLVLASAHLGGYTFANACLYGIVE